MKAALIHEFGAPPKYETFPDPTPGQDETLVTVSASALSPLAKGQAAGAHYSSEAKFPFIPGVDGVGTLSDGRRVYFAFPKSPYGAMAQITAVKNSLWVPLPDDLDDVTAAAIANPGMSSWVALTARADLLPGETVLINGATGSAGRLAVQIAKHLGAKKVIATGRNPVQLAALPALGADVTISLELPEAELASRLREEIGAGVNVILDYLWGKSAEQIIGAISGSGSPEGEPRIRYVQIGAISGGQISLPGSALRSSGLELLGSGLGSVSYANLLSAIGELMQAVTAAKLQVAAEAVPLAEVETAWARNTGDQRLVFTL